MRIASLAAIFVLAAVPVALAQSVAVPPIEGTKDATATSPGAKICIHSDPPTGSRIGAHTVCHTEAEWKNIHANSADVLMQMENRRDTDDYGQVLRNGG